MIGMQMSKTASQWLGTLIEEGCYVVLIGAYFCGDLFMMPWGSGVSIDNRASFNYATRSILTASEKL